MLAELHLSFININFIIRTQQLIPSSLDGEVPGVSSEIVYNNMNNSMMNFRNHLFKKQHKSFYNNNDVDILDEYRSIVPIGNLYELEENLYELDIRKAFTHSLNQIKEIPLFNEFDIFKPYKNEDIKQLGLYIVTSKNGNLFLNKTYNLIWTISKLF